VNAIFFENGEIVSTQDAPTIDELEFFENHGFNGSGHELAALHELRNMEDPRVTAIRITLQFVHDSSNGNLATHIAGFYGGCFPLKSQNEVARKIRVSIGLWHSTMRRYKKMLAELLADEATTPAVLRAIAGVVAEIGGCFQPRLAALQLAAACGIDLCDGKSGTDIARAFGTTKQAFQQGKKKFTDRLHLSPTRACRKHTTKFTTNNYRHPKNHEYTTITHQN